MEINEDSPLAQSFKGCKRLRRTTRNDEPSQARPEVPDPPFHYLGPTQLDPTDEHSTADAPSNILVSEFDYSVENHFKAVDTIAKLCGSAETVDYNEAEIKRLSNSVTFLRQWRDFNYKPRILRFACQHNSEQSDVMGEVTLPQFSSAAVPEKEMRNENKVGVEHSKDFVMNVGGAVWALDWCPKVDWNPENRIKSEFVAIAAHPPDSSYHKIGAVLTGRGVIQIWCLLTIYEKDVPSQRNKKSRPNPKINKTATSKELILAQKPRGRPRKKPLADTVEKIDTDNQLVRPRGRPRNKPLADSVEKIDTDKQLVESRGRPRKKPLPDIVEEIDTDNEHVQPLAIKYPMGSPRPYSSEGISGNACRQEDYQIDNNNLHLIQCQHVRSPLPDPPTPASFTLDSMSLDKNITSISSPTNFIPDDVALPRMMLCLAHNGKVVWDMKWRPVSAFYPLSRNTMGYLAVLLGSSALEVWEVPFPHAVKLVYPSLQEHIDPRFIKLQPVFRCSTLKCGDRLSIPLTVEWSVSSPHDMILAGCHDGVVAIWKFFLNDTLAESRPLVYISADTSPIRTLAWAPAQSNLEGANIIMTAGSKGFKFWDIRDPFRPLWVHPFLGTTYGLDWLSDPRCVFGCMEDGTMWLLSLERAAHDIPFAGKCHNVASKHGFHSFHCSAFAIWSLQASPLGVVAYCGEEGSTICFKPTTRQLKDPSRNRVPHILCGSILEEGPAFVIASPSPGSSFQSKSPDMKRTRLKEEERKAKEQSNSRQTADQERSRKGPTADHEGNRKGNRDEVMQSLPPKIVAMHRVRWNMNKGAEKWLCYGGAAGLVRCQEVDIF